MKILFTIILSIYIFFQITSSVSADQIAGSSAAIKNNSNTVIIQDTFDTGKIYRIKKAMQNVLKRYNSPLIGEIDSFIDACIKYKLDCYLLPSITGLESTFGRFVWPSSNNPFGWGRGYVMFKDWNESISTVAQGLRTNYINKGAQNLYDIGHIYSESLTWAPRVQFFINAFNEEERKMELFLSMNPVK